MNVQAKLGNALFDNLIKMRAQKGALNMEDVGALFEQISATLHASENAAENHFREEIAKLAVFIEQTKNEISTMAVFHGDNSKDGATLHLDAVIKATEEASHTIMDAADVIQAAADKAGGDCQKTVSEAVTKIYEACNFQDLTGQRVGKVIKILDEIDARIHNLLALFGKHTDVLEQGKVPRQNSGDDGKLLNGPQLPDTAPSQSDIDALFANYKP